MMFKYYKKYWFMVCLMPIGANAQVDFSLIVNPNITSYQNTGALVVPNSLVKQPVLQSLQTLEWQTQYKGFNLLGNVQYNINSDDLDNKPSSCSIDTLNCQYTDQTKGSMLEAYFTDSIGAIEYSIGKKITSWGVGYGNRPTDIIAQQNLQTLSLVTQQGVVQLALDYYTDLGALTLVAVPETTDGDLLALRYYQSYDEGDVQSLVAYSKNNGVQLGIAGIWIGNESIALHGELLLQESYSKSINTLVNSNSAVPLSNANPFETQKYNDGLKWLAGINYSAGNNNIIAEYWFDAKAYDQKQWQALLALSNKQQALKGTQGISNTAINGNIANNLSATNAVQLMQHNVFIRWSYEAENWKPNASILYSPEDKGAIISINAKRDYDWVNLTLGVRSFTGDSNSVYAQLLLTNQVYLIATRDF